MGNKTIVGRWKDNWNSSIYVFNEESYEPLRGRLVRLRSFGNSWVPVDEHGKTMKTPGGLTFSPFGKSTFEVIQS